MFLFKIGIVFFRIVYFFLKMFNIKNKVTFISRQSNKKSDDIKLLEKALKKENIEVVCLCKKLDNKLSYFFHMFKQMYHIATSKVVVLDGYCIIVSVLNHKKETKIIQMWHALGAFKKFGYSILDKEEGSSSKLAKAMKMHNNYDYIFASGKECIEPFSEAFNCSRKKIKVFSLPRVDLLKDKNNIEKKSNKIYEEYPKLTKKKNIVYAPTFRKNKDDIDEINKLIDSIDYKKYNLIIKFHPLSRIKIDDERVIVDRKFSTLDMLFIGDYIISDYSAIVFEAAVLEKPIYFWNYDIDSYLVGRDFYLDYKELPGIKSKNIEVILERIDNDQFDFKRLREFQKKYVNVSKSQTDDIVDFILNLL